MLMLYFLPLYYVLMSSDKTNTCCVSLPGVKRENLDASAGSFRGAVLTIKWQFFANESSALGASIVLKSQHHVNTMSLLKNCQNAFQTHSCRRILDTRLATCNEFFVSARSVHTRPTCLQQREFVETLPKCVSDDSGHFDCCGLVSDALCAACN